VALHEVRSEKEPHTAAYQAAAQPASTCREAIMGQKLLLVFHCTKFTSLSYKCSIGALKQHQLLGTHALQEATSPTAAAKALAWNGLPSTHSLS
jgi:hypothetical protein